MDLRAFEDEGFLDPSAPDLDDRRAMLEFLVGLGVSEDDLLEACRNDHIHAAGLDLVLRTGELTAADVAEQACRGLAAQDVLEIYRLLGIRLPDAGTRWLMPAEADAITLLLSATETFEGGEADEILRAAASALTGVAEAIVSVFVGGVEERIETSSSVGHLERAELTQLTAQMGVEFGRVMGLLFRHHLREAVERQRIAMAGAPNRQTRTMTVGFVDLVGFTPRSAGMTSDELVAFVRDFEARSYDIASRAGGRIVKTIGDEVMISATDTAAGITIVLDLIAEFAAGGTAPRGGVAAGVVVARQGDYFGPVVNLASRLVDQAVPGEVLADADTATALGEGFVVTPAGQRMLKGFADPVAVSSVGRP